MDGIYLNGCLPILILIQSYNSLRPNLRKTLDATPNTNVNLASAYTPYTQQQVMSFDALAMEKLRATGNYIKLLVPLTITNQRHTAIGSSTNTNSSFINIEIPSKLALAFVKCQCYRIMATFSTQIQNV